MSAAIEALREFEANLKESVAMQRAYALEQQEELAKASTRSTKAQDALDQLNDDLLDVQQGIEDLDAAEQAREAANQPDQPTNIPDHAVPWAPIVPADPAEGDN